MDRSRYKPGNPSIVALGTQSGCVHICDFTKQTSLHNSSLFSLNHHSLQCNCLAWNDNYLASGSADGSMCIWDWKELSNSQSPLQQFDNPKISVNVVFENHE